MDERALDEARRELGTKGLSETVNAALRAYVAKLAQRSRQLAGFLDIRMERLIAIWVLVMVLIGMAKRIDGELRSATVLDPASMQDARALLA